MAHRRNVLTTLGASALATPFAAVAQQPGRVWRVGILPGGPMAPRQFQWDAFRARMRELGYVEGGNVHYEVRAPEKEGAAYEALAASLVQANVDVIVATAFTAIKAARLATQRIPIVMCPSADPISEGFTTSLRQPDANLTGISIQSEETTGRRLQQVRELLPKATRVAFLWFGSSRKQLEVAEVAARALGMQLQSLEVNTVEALPPAFEAAVKARAEAVMVATSAFTFGSRAQIAELALKHRLPSSYSLPANAVAGGLMAYGPNDSEYYRQAAGFVDRLFKGAKVAELPIEQPTMFELVINLKTARALGISVPRVLMLQAARVIE
jgi:putative tryptophan/tyrosine transport system substrate-binding protein